MLDIILSIKPKYAEMILQGTKTAELRKSLPKEMPGRVYLYATDPVKRIIGWFVPGGSRVLHHIDEYHYFVERSGLSEKEFMAYGKGGKIGVILIKEVTRCDRPLPKGMRPPRNFVYLKEPCASCLCWDFPGCEACLKVKEEL